MKKLLKKISLDSEILFKLFILYICITIALFFNANKYIMAFFSTLIFIFFLVSLRHKYKNIHDSFVLERTMRKTIKKAKKYDDITIIYKALEENVLPELREEFPKHIYKYYQLGDVSSNDDRRLNNIKDNSIWSSIYTEFNDPFECQYMYLPRNIITDNDVMKQAESLWDSVMSEVHERITTICFTQNPNNMPMWAHYANEHKGFCVEYQINDSSNLYPVFYVGKRFNAQSLFVELLYNILNKNREKVNNLYALKFIALLSTFKDDGWKYENEIRAVFWNLKKDIPNKGKLYSCEEIGVQPTKIYIGAKCSESNKRKLVAISQELNVPYFECSLSLNENFNVVEENNNA